MGKKQISKTLNVFTKRVKREFQPEEVFLFGSYAKNTATEHSDIDVLVIASSFENMSFDERLIKLHRLASDLEPDINAFGFTADEIQQQNYITTVKDALATGIRI